MNITKKNKIQADISPQSKSYLIISTNYQIDNLYNLLRKNPSLVNAKDNKKETFLSYAIKRKNVEIAELILTSPILDYSYQDKDGNSYLHLAVINQLENIIRTLIKKGINVNLQNNEGNTALHFAYSTGDIKFITIMIESKVDFTIKNKNGLIAEEVPPGTFPEILDINNNNQNNNVNITHNKNNTVTINLNVDNNNENNKENDKDNNGVIINERGQINKSIRINWESNHLANNISNDINNNEALNNNISNNNILINNNLDNDNNNINKLETTSKTKLKYSLVNFSYSDEEEDGEGEGEGEGKAEVVKKGEIEGELEGEIVVEGEVEEEEEENGIVSKQDININKNDEKKKKNKIKTSDIFDLASSLRYQEKVANASFINAQTIGEPKILSKQDSNELGTSEDIVNINKVKESQNNPTLSLENDELKNMISNGIDMSQVTFQTVYENGRNMNISQVNYNNRSVRSVDFRNQNIGERNGQNVVFDYSTSISKEGGINDINEIINKRESEGICNFDNNNVNQSNTQRPQVEFTQDFAFSPVTTLKEPLNRQVNGSEINIKSSNNINKNSKNLSNVNIDKEIKSEKKNNSNKNFNIEANSTILKRCDALTENSMQKNKLNISNKTNVSNYKDDNETLTNIAKSSPTKSNYIRNINTNLSQASQNNINPKTNTKINFNCPVNNSEDTVNTSVTKNSHDSLYKFLAEIRMEKYYDIMISNGFDDINLLINQTKSGLGIKDKQLKQAGINLPGDRAKILIKLQEKAGDYIFPIPKEVYYTSQSDNIKNDRNIKKLNDWLKALKVEIYLENFVKNGYHSIELLLMQIESKNPLTDEILKDEVGITKIGHRSRIINKLLEEGKSNINKLKTSMLYLGNNLTEKICDCSIF